MGERTWLRRGVLASLGGVVAAGLTAGCTQDANGEETDQPSPTTDSLTTTSPTRTPTETPSPTQTTALPLGTITTPQDCPDAPRVPDANTHPDDADLPPVPDPPGSLTDEDSLIEYVEAYEEAYRWRRATNSFNDVPIVRADVNMNATVRGSQPDAVLLDLHHVMIHGRVDYGNEEPGHFDGGEYTVSYLVTPAAVWRASEREVHGEPTPELEPRKDGELIECF